MTISSTSNLKIQLRKPKAQYSKYYNPKIRRQNYEKNFENELAYAKDKRNEIMRKLKSILGNKCSNPNCRVPGGMDNRFCLQIDHKDGGGNKERIAFGGGLQMWKYYSEHPEEARAKLQILCANCNWIKRGEMDEARQYRRVTPKEQQSEVVTLKTFISEPFQSN